MPSPPSYIAPWCFQLLFVSHQATLAHVAMTPGLTSVVVVVGAVVVVVTGVGLLPCPAISIEADSTIEAMALLMLSNVRGLHRYPDLRLAA